MKYKLKKAEVAFIAIILLFVSGCTTTSLKTINQVDVNNLTENQSVLILSTGAGETCQFSPVSIVMKKANGQPGIVDSLGVYWLNNTKIKSFFKYEYGLVYTTVLEPGSYDFWLNSANPFLYYPFATVGKSFTLKPKEIKYIGEIYVDRCGDGQLKITNQDKTNRDFAYIKYIVPDIELSDIVIEPLHLYQNESTHK